VLSPERRKGVITVVIWINGAFGAGKTTLAQELHGRLPDSMLFDPESVGSILRDCFPAAASDDFQDLPAWRKLTAQFVLTLREEYGRPVIVPMTVVEPEYRREIFGAITAAGEPVLHIFLEASAEELRRRIEEQVLFADDPAHEASARSFRHRNVERCVAARSELPSGTLTLRSDRHSPAQLADLVLRAISG
jgi:adenylylsulfate kinase-like enzyme